MDDFNTILQQLGGEETPPPSTLITNVASARDQNKGRTVFLGQEPKPTQEIQQPQPQSNIYDAGFATVRDYATRISEAKSYEDKQRLMLDLRTSAISIVESAQLEAQAKAESVFNLTRLRDQHQFALRKVQRFPEFQDQLIAFEKQLQQAESKSIEMTNNLMKSNMRLQTFIKTVDNELAIQNKMAEQHNMLQLKRLEKEEFAKEAAADVLAGVKPEALDTLTQIFPAMKGDIVAIAKFVTSSGKDWKPILDGQIPEDKYLQSALLGHKPSRVMAIVEEAKRTGNSIKSVESQVDYAETLLNNPDLFAKEKARYLGVSEKEMKNEAAKKLLNKVSKDELAAQRQKDIGDIEKIMAAKTEQRLQDITTWAPNTSPLTDPEGQKIFAELQQKLSRTPNVVEFAKAFVNAPDLTPEIRKTRVHAIQSGYEAAAKASQKTLLHVPISDGQIKDNMRKLEVSAVVDNIASRAGAFIGKNLTGAADITPMANVLKFHENVLQSEYNSLESFFKGLISGGSK